MVLRELRERTKYIVRNYRVIALFSEARVGVRKYVKEGREYRYGYVHLLLPPDWVGKDVVVVAMDSEEFYRMVVLMERFENWEVHEQSKGVKAETKYLEIDPREGRFKLPPSVAVPLGMEALKVCTAKCIDLPEPDNKRCIARCFNEIMERVKQQTQQHTS